MDSFGPLIVFGSSYTRQIPAFIDPGILRTPSFASPFHVSVPHALPARPDGLGFIRDTVQKESGAPLCSHRVLANLAPTPYSGSCFASSNTVWDRGGGERASGGREACGGETDGG